MAGAQTQATPSAPPVATPGGTLPGNSQVQLVKVAGGLADPVNIAAPDDGSGRLFVVERIGLIRIIDKNGELLPDPFLDIQQAVKTDFLEQGLLGLAFHPNYKTNGLFYVTYNDFHASGADYLVQYHVSASDPNKADPNSAKLLLAVPQPFVDHDGGTIRFGPDGDLYWVLGDGGLAGDPYNYAQDLPSLHGKLLRIQVPADTNAGYAIPADNPFAHELLPSDAASKPAQNGHYPPNARPEIWDLGLRNSQFSFDPKTGDLYLVDLGQNQAEEIDFQPAGSKGGWNFGWPIREGTFCLDTTVAACPHLGVPPVAEYTHQSGNCAITQIGVYRGTISPSLDGIFFTSDYCTGRIYGLERTSSGWVYQELLATGLQATGGGPGPGNELYMTTCTCQYGRGYNPLANPGGAVWRLVQADKVPAGAQMAPTVTPVPAAASPVAPAASPAATPGGQSAGPVSVAGSVTIRMTDQGFEPNAVEATNGHDLTITLVNSGTRPHNFSVDHYGIDVTLAPGQTKTVTIHAPDLGTYPFYSNAQGDEGMTGELTFYI